MRWAGHVVRMGEQNIRTDIGEPEGNIPHGEAPTDAGGYDD
jgi:hypothetical protein